MSKKQFLLTTAFAGLFATSVAAQAPKWVIGNSLVNFSGSPQITNTLLGSAEPSNGAFDNNGNLLFHVKGGTIYTMNGSSLQAFGGLSTLPYEVGIVNVPGSCNRFYVIAFLGGLGSSSHTNPVYLRYTMVEVNNGIVSLVPNLSNISLGIVSDGRAGLAITQLRKNKTRFLFTLGKKDGLKKFIISNNGISFANSLGSFINSNPAELDAYDEPSNGSIKLAWGDSNTGVNVLLLNNQGNLNSHNNGSGEYALIPSIVGLDRVYGVEFIDDHRVVFGVQRTYQVQYQLKTFYEVGIFDFATNYIVTYIPNSDKYYDSQIERAIDGKIYTSKENIVSGNVQGYKLASIDYNNLTINEVPNLTLPAMGNSLVRQLPDQIDNENYTAANYSYDLAAFDNSADIGIEPYVPGPNDWQIWQSKDIWGRATDAGSVNGNLTPENVDNATGHNNLVRFRVRNIGCSESNPSHAKLYWTVGTTGGEPWPVAWTGDIHGGEITSAYPTSITPAGQDVNIGNGNNSTTPTSYTPGLGFDIPALKPGEEYIINAIWKPSNFGLSNTSYPQICYLARILDSNDLMYDERDSNGTFTFNDNVKSNNNIVTRNSTFVPLSGGGVYYRGTGTIFFSNSTDIEDKFDFAVRDVSNNGGIPFSDLGDVLLTLDKDLFDRWIAGGSQAEGIEIADWEKHELRVTDIAIAKLKNIALNAGEYRAIALSFELSQDTDVVQDYHFAAFQNLSQTPDEEYGTVCNFIVSVNGAQQDPGKPFCEGDGNCDDENGAAATATASVFKGDIKLSPNPSSDQSVLEFALNKDTELNVELLDTFGKPVKTVVKSKDFRQGDQSIDIDISDLESGVYRVLMYTSSERKLINLIKR